jgi:hypothetical protein
MTIAMAKRDSDTASEGVRTRSSRGSCYLEYVYQTLLIGSVGCGAKMSTAVLVQMYPQRIVAQMEEWCQIGEARRSCSFLPPLDNRHFARQKRPRNSGLPLPLVALEVG